MDKNAIKKYAVWARRELIARVSQRALQFGITETEMSSADADSINGRLLSSIEKQQRRALMVQIETKGFTEVMEEVAYTWFNRFSALRFMEVNGYLPTHIRVFTDDGNNFKPQIIDEAIHLELEGLDKEKVFAYKEANQTEELYKYLLITQCNALNGILPGMFQKISDYTELLLPDNLLREGSVIHQMIELISEEDWKDAVQIIGWLYQYYISEKKDFVFAALKKNVKITKENIPAATQLFTPDWIVRYMVENSLGRLWVEGHPETAGCFMPTAEEQKRYADGERDPKDIKWHYYLEEAQQEPEVQAQLAEIRKGYASMVPKDIKVIDPCCGSGHILAYLFDVLMQIYESSGYTSRDAVTSILQNNLYGLDIDDRAAQLAYFTVMMKARQHDRRFFSHTEQPRVYAICESNHLDAHVVDYFCKEDATLTEAIQTIQKELFDAKEYGSILTVTPQDWNALYNRFDEISDDNNMFRDLALTKLLQLVRVAETLAQKYDAVVTNPPYMGSSGMSEALSGYVKKHYLDSKSDLFAVFIETCGRMTKANGYQAMITQHAWMFLSSFEKLRVKLLTRDIVNMAHLGPRAFEEIGGEVVQTTSFVIQNSHTSNRKGVYNRLIEPTTQNGKEDLFLAGKNCHQTDQANFSKIPGSPVAYWATEKIYKAYANTNLDEIAKPRHGLATSNNARFLRLWFEVDTTKASLHTKCQLNKKWFPMNKGGNYRKWYGNLEWVINYEDDGKELKDYAISIYKCSTRTIQNTQFYFKESLTWSALTSGIFSVRWSDEGALFGSGGYSAFIDNDKIIYILGVMNSKVNSVFIKIVSPTLNYEVGHIKTIPVVIAKDFHTEINRLTELNISLSRSDWDSFETSWDFQVHPLVSMARNRAQCGDNEAIDLDNVYRLVKQDYKQRFQQLKSNEEELNRIFIDIYGLQDELTPEVEDKDVTVYRYFDEKEDIPASMGKSRYALTRRDMIVSFISYAVGCMLGRYSLDMEGLAFAGGEWDESKYVTFPADKDNIIPICDDEYFNDDIVGRFVAFVKTVYGAETLEDNLRFIADALGGKGQPRDIIRRYFLNDFFKDHCQTYQKRPIYWLFDSGRKNGFKALIYMHRYQPDTLARIRTDYVHEQQSRYRTSIADVEQRMTGAGTGERVKLGKTLSGLQEQETELRLYEEKIHHLADQMISIDLDDGVKHNYGLFQDVLAQIK